MYITMLIIGYVLIAVAAGLLGHIAANLLWKLTHKPEGKVSYFAYREYKLSRVLRK